MNAPYLDHLHDEVVGHQEAIVHVLTELGVEPVYERSIVHVCTYLRPSLVATQP